jgi:hypothetical protein
LKCALIFIGITREKLTLGANILIHSKIGLVAFDGNGIVPKKIVSDSRPVVRHGEQQRKSGLGVRAELAGRNLISGEA